MARETKIGLLLILVLVCAFSVVLYKRMRDRQDGWSDDEGVAGATSDPETKPRKKHDTDRRGPGRKIRDGGATSFDQQVPANELKGQNEPRRLADATTNDQWTPPASKDKFAPSGHPARNDDHGASQNPFGGGTTVTQNDQRKAGSGFGGDTGNPFGGGAGETGAPGKTPAKSVGFGVSEPEKSGRFGRRQGSPFETPEANKTAQNHQDGSATSLDETPRQKTGTVRLFPAKQGSTATHQPAAYVEKKPVDGRATTHATEKEHVFGLDADPPGRAKQMQPLGDGGAGNSGGRFGETDDRFAKDGRKFDQRGQRFANKTPDGEHDSLPIEKGLGAAQRKTAARSETGSSLGAGTDWPPRKRDAKKRFKPAKSEFGGPDGQAFSSPETRKTQEQSNGFPSTETQRGGSRIGGTTTGSKFGSPDGSATSYDERPVQTPPGERPTYYTVQPGDNYWTISRKTYGTARYFLALARYNQRRIPDPKRMRPGMHVLTPSAEVLQSSNPDLFPRRRRRTTIGVHQSGEAQAGFFRDASGRPLYRVGKGDTLSDIAQKHLGRASRWIQVYEMNKERLRNSKTLTIGTELRLPADASRIRLVRGTREFR